MKKILYGWTIILFFASYSWGAPYPEFAGNYINCGGRWCDLTAYELSVMSLWEVLSVNQGTRGSNIVMHAGYFTIPDTITLENRRPEILMYSGRTQADPRTVALVELGELPFNNAPIGEINGKKYHQKVKYTKENVKNQLWTYKREIRLKYKPIEGKTGMAIYQPAEDLSDGLYVIDSGMPTQDGHTGLSSAPEVMGFYKSTHPQVAIPIIIGSIHNVNKTVDNFAATQTKDLVLKIQENLDQLGYYPGSIDGVMGERTAIAIKEFQQKEGLTIDGKPTEGLLNQLEAKLMKTEKSQTNLEKSVNKAVDGVFKSIFGK